MIEHNEYEYEHEYDLEYNKLIKNIKDKKDFKEIKKYLIEYYKRYKNILIKKHKLLEFIENLIKKFEYFPWNFLFKEMILSYINTYRINNEFITLKKRLNQFITEILETLGNPYNEIDKEYTSQNIDDELYILENKMDLIIEILKNVEEINFFNSVLNNSSFIDECYIKIKKLNINEKLQQELIKTFLKKVNEILDLFVNNTNITDYLKELIFRILLEIEGDAIFYDTIFFRLDLNKQNEILKELLTMDELLSNFNLINFINFCFSKIDNLINIDSSHYLLFLKNLRLILRTDEFYNNLKISLRENEREEFVLNKLILLKNKFKRYLKDSICNNPYLYEIFFLLIYKSFTYKIFNIEKMFNIINNYEKSDIKLNKLKTLICFFCVNNIDSIRDLMEYYKNSKINVFSYADESGLEIIKYSFITTILEKISNFNFKKCSQETINIINELLSDFLHTLNTFKSNKKIIVNLNKNFQILISLYEKFSRMWLNKGNLTTIIDNIYNSLKIFFIFINNQNIYFDFIKLIKLILSFQYRLIKEYYNPQIEIINNDFKFINKENNDIHYEDLSEEDSENIEILEYIDEWLEHLFNLIVIKNYYPQLILNSYSLINILNETTNFIERKFEINSKKILYVYLLNSKIIRILNNYKEQINIKIIKDKIEEIIRILNNLDFKHKKDFINHLKYEINFSLNLFNIESVLLQLFEYMLKNVALMFLYKVKPKIDWNQKFTRANINRILKKIRKVKSEINRKNPPDKLLNILDFFIFQENDLNHFFEIRQLRNDFFHINKYLSRNILIDEINKIIEGFEKLIKILIELFGFYEKDICSLFNGKNEYGNIEFKISFDQINQKFYLKVVEIIDIKNELRQTILKSLIINFDEINKWINTY